MWEVILTTNKEDTFIYAVLLVQNRNVVVKGVCNRQTRGDKSTHVNVIEFKTLEEAEMYYTKLAIALNRRWGAEEINMEDALIIAYFLHMERPTDMEEIPKEFPF